MFGIKLRSWMEAVRPRKKQQRKEKQAKSASSNKQPVTPPTQCPNWQHSQNDTSVADKKIAAAPAASSRYSANNLSSPESAYSTGYSTDGTSPGAPPEYFVNMKTGAKNFAGHSIHVETNVSQRSKQEHSPGIPTVTVQQSDLRPPVTDVRATPIFHHPNRLREQIIPSPILTSPRQRNRIRTNPWLPGNCPSPNPIRDTLITVTPVLGNSPVPPRIPNTRTTQRKSLSSSSCSSLSGASVYHWDGTKKDYSGSEDDCTLNEMMGKYDESYVYEKETDILSDSDPTDCDETDIDTGQDGGDEDDPEAEFDFIDNGSYLEIDPRDERNTGHCTYHNYERRLSRRKTTRRSKQSSEKRRRSSSNKKRHKNEKPTVLCQNGSKSAGATPVSVRRTKHHPVSKLALEDCLKKRSNSISFSGDPLNTIDKRDKEADKKYKELIVEADHILRTMKNGLSPSRRLPGPANKRVEILRSAECTIVKPNNRLMIDEPISATPHTKIPSSNFNCPRFSPKRNHITKFIINNSPLMMRREMVPVVKKPESPVFGRNRGRTITEPAASRRSPKYRKKSMNKAKLHAYSSSSSDSEVEGLIKDGGHATKTDPFIGCPQSEPARRKVYSGRAGKTVAFNLNSTQQSNHMDEYQKSSENLRQQVLLNTIANLKRSLEDQSASLKQVYRSSHNLQV